MPTDWHSVELRSICRLVNGRGFKPHEWETSGLPIIRIQNLNGSDNFNFFQGQYQKKLEVETGQLPFAWSGSRGTSFGPHVWSGPKGLLNYHTWKIDLEAMRVHANYFYHQLRQLTKFIENNAHGASALVHVQKWQMEGFEIPVPPSRDEQEAIALILEDMDHDIGAIQDRLRKSRKLK